MTAMLAAGFGFSWLALRPTAEDRRQEALVELQAIGQGELRALTAYAQIVAASRSRSVTELEAAERIEREVLPAWKGVRARVEAVRSGPLADYFPPELAEFFRLRQESLESLVEGVRRRDAAAIARHQEMWRASDVIAAKLEGKLPADPNAAQADR